jgi:PAS domain S-box-containing protein
MNSYADELRQFCKDDAAFEHVQRIVADAVGTQNSYFSQKVNSNGNAYGTSNGSFRAIPDPNLQQWLVRLIDEVLPDMIYLYNPRTGQYLYTNKAIAQFGYTSQELMEQGAELAIAILHPDEQDNVITNHREQLISVGRLPIGNNLLFTPFFDVQCRLQCADGSYRWVQDRRYVLERDAEGRVEMVLGYLHDIHSLKVAQNLLEYQTALEKVTASVSRRFAKTGVLGIDEAISESLREFGEFTAADRCYIYLAPQSAIMNSTMSLMDMPFEHAYDWCAQGIEPATIRLITPASLPWAFERLNQLRSLQITHIHSLSDKAEPLRSALLAADTKSILAVPLHIERRVIGVLGMSSVRDERVWTKEEVRAIRLIGETFVHAFERKHAELALRSSEARFRTIFDRAPLAVSVISPQGLVLSCNEQFVRLLGYAEKQLTGRSFLEFIRPDDRERSAELFYELLSGSVEVYTLEAQHIHRTGAPVWTSGTSSLVRGAEGKPAFVIRMLEDISDRKTAEANMQHYTTLLSEHKGALERQSDMLLQLNGELMHKQSELQELNQSKDKFFSIISHDLRSPFSSLLGISKILADGSANLGPAEIQELAAAMNTQANSVFEFMENLLKWAQAHTGRMSYEPTVVTLSEISTAITLLLNENAQSKGITLENAIADNVCIYADENMIRSVMQNLVSNALKFTPVGGTVRIAAAQSAAKPKFAEVSVSDTGIGMTAEDAEKLFRIDVVHTTKGTEDETGSGLGLILCHELVEKNGGTIRVQSALGKGTTFTFTVPLAMEL